MSAHLRLAGVTRLAVRARHGPLDAFVFDPHRLALPCWHLALAGRGPALLVTFDRHLDLVPPSDRAAVPDAAAGLRAIDEHARWALDVKNYDHVVAAMEAGLVGDVLAIARSQPAGALGEGAWTDRRGGLHRIVASPALPPLLSGGGREGELGALLAGGGPVLLDVDLDCFTTTSDADPTAVVPWTEELVREHLLPEGARALWDALLPRCAALTLAREPHHVGGLVAGGRLFEVVARVLFGELLGADLP